MTTTSLYKTVVDFENRKKNIFFLKNSIPSSHSGCINQTNLVKICIPTFQLPTVVNSINWWITIHQKLDDTTDFNLYWSDYKAGFGIPGVNVWIGLERMHQMTSSTTPYRLRVEVQSSYNNLWYSAEYDSFLIDNEAGGYAIHVTGYHGDAGDAMQYLLGSVFYQNGMKFSTRDFDNDLVPSGSCAIQYGVANWYNCCHAFLLTGSSINNGWRTLSTTWDCLPTACVHHEC